MWLYLVLVAGLPLTIEQMESRLGALTPMMRFRRLPWGWAVTSDYPARAILAAVRVAFHDRALLLVAAISEEGLHAHNVSLLSELDVFPARGLPVPAPAR